MNQLHTPPSTLQRERKLPSVTANYKIESEAKLNSFMQKPGQTRVRWLRSSNAKHYNLFDGIKLLIWSWLICFIKHIFCLVNEAKRVWEKKLNQKMFDFIDSKWIHCCAITWADITLYYYFWRVTMKIRIFFSFSVTSWNLLGDSGKCLVQTRLMTYWGPAFSWRWTIIHFTAHAFFKW